MPPVSSRVCSADRMAGLRACRLGRSLSPACCYRAVRRRLAFFHAGPHRPRDLRQLGGGSEQSAGKCQDRRKGLAPAVDPQACVAPNAADLGKGILAPMTASDVHRLKTHVQRQIQWQLQYAHWRQATLALAAVAQGPWIPSCGTLRHAGPSGYPRLSASAPQRPDCRGERSSRLQPTARTEQRGSLGSESPTPRHEGETDSKFDSPERRAPQAAQPGRLQPERRVRLGGVRKPRPSAPLRASRSGFSSVGAEQREQTSRVKSPARHHPGPLRKAFGGKGTATTSKSEGVFVSFEEFWAEDDVARALNAGVAFRGVLQVSAVKTEKAVSHL